MGIAKHKKIDAKGRLLLGEKFANQSVIIETQKDGTILLKPAVVIPITEAWLYKNKSAFQSVKRGLEQASGGQFVEDPRSSKGDKFTKDEEE